MKKKIFNPLFIIFSFLCIPMILSAQPGMGYGPHDDFPFSPKHGNKMKETIHTVMLIEMTKFVGLSNKQALEISPVLDEIAALKEENKKNHRKNLQKLKEMLEPEADEKQIKNHLEAIKKADKNFRQKNQELREKMLSGLSTPQQAKMLLFQAHFRSKMKDIMGHARRMENRKRIMEERDRHLNRTNEKKNSGR